jgi:hypothetical protein
MQAGLFQAGIWQSGLPRFQRHYFTGSQLCDILSARLSRFSSVSGMISGTAQNQ